MNMPQYTKEQILHKVSYYISKSNLIPNYVVKYADEQNDIRKLEEILAVVYNIYQKEQQMPSNSVSGVMNSIKNFFSGVLLGHQTKKKQEIYAQESKQSAIDQKDIDSLFKDI